MFRCKSASEKSSAAVCCRRAYVTSFLICRCATRRRSKLAVCAAVSDDLITPLCLQLSVATLFALSESAARRSHLSRVCVYFQKCARNKCSSIKLLTESFRYSVSSAKCHRSHDRRVARRTSVHELTATRTARARTTRKPTSSTAVSRRPRRHVELAEQNTFAGALARYSANNFVRNPAPRRLAPRRQTCRPPFRRLSPRHRAQLPHPLRSFAQLRPPINCIVRAMES